MLETQGFALFWQSLPAPSFPFPCAKLWPVLSFASGSFLSLPRLCSCPVPGKLATWHQHSSCSQGGQCLPLPLLGRASLPQRSHLLSPAQLARKCACCTASLQWPRLLILHTRAARLQLSCSKASSCSCLEGSLSEKAAPSTFLRKDMDPDIRNMPSRRWDNCAVRPSALFKCLTQGFLRETGQECKQSEQWGQTLGWNADTPLKMRSHYGWIFFHFFVRSGGAPFLL